MNTYSLSNSGEFVNFDGPNIHSDVYSADVEPSTALQKSFYEHDVIALGSPDVHPMPTQRSLSDRLPSTSDHTTTTRGSGFGPTASGQTRFKRFTRSNPCPICGGHKGCAETSNQVIHCKGKPSTVPAGYKQLKDDSSIGFQRFAPDTGAARTRARVTPLIEARSLTSLDAKERDRNYKRIAKLSGLSTRHHQNLQDRGIDDTTIDQWYANGLIFTWQSGEHFPGINAALPGVNPKTMRLTGLSGLAFAVTDTDGHIIGLQVKVDDGGGYRWISSGTNRVHINDNLPLTYVGHIGPIETLDFVEGIAKPRFSSDRHGINCLGAGGTNWAASAPMLNAYLDDLQPTTVILNPDSGMLDDPHYTVIVGYDRLRQLLEKRGITLQIRWWGQDTKADGDLDEIDSTTFTTATLIDWKTFLSKLDYDYAKKIGKAPTPIVTLPTPLTAAPSWQEQERNIKARRVARVLELSDFTPLEDIPRKLKSTLYVEGDRTVGYVEPIELPKMDRSLHVLCSAMGTGKTSNGVYSVVKQAIDGNMDTLIMVPTQKLSQNLAQSLRDLFNEREPGKGYADHIASKNDNGGHYWQTARVQVLCPESMHRIKENAYDLVILDEVDESMGRIVQGGLNDTSNRKRQIKTALVNILGKSKHVLISQDGVSVCSLELCQRLGHYADGQIHKHLYALPDELKGNVAIALYTDVYDPLSYEKTDEQERDRPRDSMGLKSMLNELQETIALGRKTYIDCGSRTRGNGLYRALRLLFPHLSVVFFEGDSRSVVGKQMKDSFCENPEAWLIANQPDILIHTPCIGSGVSVDPTDPYFDAHFSIGSGSEGAEAQKQRGGRLRDSMRGERIKFHHVYVSNANNLIPDAVKDNLKLSEIEAQLSVDLYQRLESVPDEAADILTQELTLLSALIPFQARYQQLERVQRYFDLGLLRLDWQRRGWDVIEVEGSQNSDLFTTMRNFIASDNNRLTNIIARAGVRGGKVDIDALKPPKVRLIDGQTDYDGKPIAKVKAIKKTHVETLGIDFEHINNADWYLSFIFNNHSPIRTKTMTVRALTRLGLQYGKGLLELLAEIKSKDQTLSRPLHENSHLPMSLANVQQALLMMDCPVIQEYEYGTLPEKWCRTDRVVGQTQQWAIANDHRLNNIAKVMASGRGNAYKFTNKTPALKVVSKLLSMYGIEDASAGKEGHANVRYRRLRTLEDALQKLVESDAPDNLIQQSLECDYLRYELKDATMEALEIRLIQCIEANTQLKAAIEHSKRSTTYKVRSHFTPDLVPNNGDKIAIEYS